MIRPKLSDNFDFEGELTMVIGKGGRHIPIERALDHVAGYTIFVDGSVRDYQKFSVTSGKNWPGTGPLGPWLVTSDEIPDPGKLTLTTRLNGQQVQHSGTDKLIYSCQQIVSFCSDFTTLHPGDIIATGTPEGVGHSRKPPLWMKPGDVLEVEISQIGVLRTTDHRRDVERRTEPTTDEADCRRGGRLIGLLNAGRSVRSVAVPVGTRRDGLRSTTTRRGAVAGPAKVTVC